MGNNIMGRKRVVCCILLIFFFSGCQNAPTPQPTGRVPTETSPFPETATSTRTELSNSTEASGSTTSLETLSAANIQSMIPLVSVGEGTFGDHLAVSPAGDVLAIATAGGVLLVNATTGQRRSFFPASSRVESLDFSPDGQQLATIHREPGQEVIPSGELAGQQVYNPLLTIYDSATGQVRFSLNLSGSGCGHYAAWDLSFAPDGKSLVLRDEYSQLGHTRTDDLCVFSASDGALIRAIPIDLPWRSTSPVLFTPDGRQMILGVTSTEGSTPPTTRVRFYDAATGALLREIDGQGSLNDLALSADGSTLALADPSGAHLLSVQDGSLLGHYGDHSREVLSVAFSPDGTQLALGSLDSTVSVWSLADGQKGWQSAVWRPYTILKEEDGTGEIWDLAFSPNGAVLFALAPTHQMDTAGRVHALQTSNGQEVYHIDGYNTLSHPDLSPDHRKVAFGGYEDGQVQVRSVAEDRLLFTLLGHTGLVTSVAFTPDGKQIASASLDGTVRIWNAEDGAPIRTLPSQTGPVRAVQFSPDGAQLVSTGDDGSLRLWNAVNGQLLETLATQTDNWLVNSITFTPDGQNVLLAYGCAFYSSCQFDSTGDLRQMNLVNGQVKTLIPYGVFSITLSADQSVFAIEGAEQRQSGQRNGEQYMIQRAYLSPLGNGALVGAAISPDGQLFFSGNAFGLHVWNAASGEMLTLCKGTPLSYGEIRITPDQTLVFIAGPDGMASLWGIPAER